MYLFEHLLQIIKQYLPQEQIDLVKRAFVVARDAHEGQSRSSGEPYITHPVSVASIVAEMQLDHEAVMAALLHDVIEDTPYTEQQLTVEFGSSVAEIVEGVSKLDKLKFRTRKEAEVENFRKMILAMTKDIRVVLIKLADRTHNMRTLGALRPDKRRRIAKETLEIYAPLAHRLGIEHIRKELEDLSFEAMYPSRYALLQRITQMARGNRKDMIQKITDEICQRLQDIGIQARVFGKERHAYDVYQRLRLKDQEFHSIMDIYAFRIVVKDIDTCYRVLGQVHGLYKPRPGRVRDYIAVPKGNGYQSIHTSMIGSHGVPVEVYIRTEEMDKMADLGVVAYWAYNKDGKNDATTAQIRAQRWLQSLIELQQSAGNSLEFIENVKSEFFPKEIYVFTPKGRIVQLPVGATPVDFAYAVHSNIGRLCVAANVDYRSYPLSQPLQSGQTIEIITAPDAKADAKWLNFVKTAKARSNIRQALKNLRSNSAITLGKQLLNEALAPITIADISSEKIQPLLTELKLATFDDLLAEIGLGNQLSQLIAHRLLDKPITIITHQAQNLSDVKTTDKLPLSFAQCCHPIPGDPVIALPLKNKSLIIHHCDCANTKSNQNEHERLNATWEKDIDSAKVCFETELHLKIAHSQHDTLSHLTSLISSMQSNIQGVWTEEHDGFCHIMVQIMVKNNHHLDEIIAKIKTIPHLVKVTRNINH